MLSPQTIESIYCDTKLYNIHWNGLKMIYKSLQ